MQRRTFALLALGALLPMEKPALDLSRAAVFVSPAAPPRVVVAAQMLVDEIAERTRLRLLIVRARPTGVCIEVGVSSGVARPEGFRLHASGDSVTVAGHDERGALFGVGKLLRALRLTRDRIELSLPVDLTSAPQTPLRGHQLGYRPKTNSYDAWDEAQWERYVRDLIVFGCNAIELIPPRSDDAPDSPHFPLPPLAMLTKMSALGEKYGLDVWLWYPALDPDYTDEKAVDAAVAEWDAVFRATPRLDAVFVPGGDPGHTAPGPLMRLLERQKASLVKSHPRAQLWVSPQGFDAVWMDEFLALLAKEPAWLDGIVFGPQVRLPLPELRKRIPARYPIRHYPDITHSTICQYPVPDWDIAFALTSGREGINPRPMDQRRIFRATHKDTIGFLAYSEGCNDDVNKAVWSALGWDRDADIAAVLREYGSYFIGGTLGDAFGKGLLALERNGQGPLIANAAVETTLRQFQAMERAASPAQRANWRFQQALYRAYSDGYTRRRLIRETEQETEAVGILEQAARRGALSAMADAETALRRAAEPVAPELRERIFALAEALFQSVGMQLSVVKYGAIAVDRGASLDTLDTPLNDRLWYFDRFAEARALPTEAQRLDAIRALLRWRDPGPGGFYDDLGDPTNRPHLVGRHDLDADPGTFRSPRTGFDRLWSKLSWSRYAETLYDAPLQMRYTGLDPNASYAVRIAYAIQAEKRKIRLTAGEGIEIHPPQEKPVPTKVLEYPIPAAAIVDGALTLTWTNVPGLGSNGRGCQVCEVWLVRSETLHGR